MSSVQVMAIAVMAVVLYAWLIDKWRSRRQARAAAHSPGPPSVPGSDKPGLTWQRRPVSIAKILPMLKPALAVFSLAGAARGQYVLLRPGATLKDSLFWFLFAGVGLAALLFWKPPEKLEAILPMPVLVGHSPYALVMSILLAFITLNIIVEHERSPALFYWDAVVFWIASCVAYLGVFHWPGRSWWLERVRTHRAEILLVMGLTVLAALLRFLWLDRLPDVMNGDEGIHGLYARQILEGLFVHPFATFYGAGTLHLSIVALGIKLLGPTVMATRLTPALGGVLGVPATYLLTRRLFGSRAAFVSAGLVAVLHSHIQFSRVLGVGYVHATLFASLGIYLLYSALETHSQLRAALGGVVMGVWLYVYIDSRFVLAVLAVWLVVLMILPRHRAFVMSQPGRLAAFAGGYVVAAAPMGLWAARHWDDFQSRFNSDGTLWTGYYAKVMAQNPRLDLKQFLLEQVSHVFFTITRYPVYDFYQSPAPLLDAITASLFWLAIIYSALHALDRRHVLLNIWLWSGVVAIGVLTVPRSSDGYRLLIVLIPIVILVGLVAEQLAQRLAAVFSRPSWAVWGMLSVLLVAVLAINVDIYFNRYRTSCRYGGDRVTRLAYSLGETLAQMRFGDHATFIGNEYFSYGTHASAVYLNPGIEVRNIQGPLTSPQLGWPLPQTFILIPERLADLDLLRIDYPGGQERQVRDCNKVALYVYSLH